MNKNTGTPTDLVGQDWIFESELDDNMKKEKLLRCDCSKIIYDDVKDYFMKLPHFKENYDKIVSGKFRKFDILPTHPFCHLLKTILDTSDDFKKYWDLTLNYTFDELVEFEYGYLIPYAKYGFVPHKRSWYNRTCKNVTSVYNEHDEHIYDYDCCQMGSENLQTSIMGMFVTFLYETITQDKVLSCLHEFIKKYPSYGDALIKQLSDTHNHLVVCQEWKGVDYYYRKIFHKSFYLKDIPITKEELLLKQYGNFEAQICGHPRASDGWMKEGWEEISNLYNSACL